jgi:RNA 2',3'-cyclic 3'-phosphodiesterase
VSGPRARMFVALDLPASTREAIAAWRDEVVAGRNDLRPVAPEALHVTLAFLGWQDESAAPRIAEAAFGPARGMGPPRLAAAEVLAIPPRGAPRLFALDPADEEGRAVALQQAVSDALEAERFYKPEKRPFWPHVTLARVKRGQRAGPLPELPAPPRDAFDADELTLYRSTLRPQGALYEPLARGRVGTGGSAPL